MKNRFLRSIKIFTVRLLAFMFFLFLSACDDFFSLRKELEEEFPFSPKLSVTAILNTEGGIFDIKLMEGISIAEATIKEKENIRDGEIRLYEDDVLVFSRSGPFDMSSKITSSTNMWKYGKNGYHYVAGGIYLRPGSVCRLEVEIEGYPMAVATSAVPSPPTVSAKMDTSVQVVRKNVKEHISIGYSLYNMGGFGYDQYPEKYWPFAVSVDLSDVNNYLAIDLLKMEFSERSGDIYWWGIGASDLFIFLENGMNRELVTTDHADLYLFSMLMASDFKGVARNYYAAVDQSLKKPDVDDSQFENNPDFEKITTKHTLFLRVRNITPATYRYYQSLSMQYADKIFNEQPIPVVGNFEGAFGIFSVYGTTNLTLLEWETYQYQEK